MKQQESVVYLERSGMTLRVPESRLKDMSSTGSGSRAKSDPRRRKQLREELKRRILSGSAKRSG